MHKAFITGLATVLCVTSAAAALDYPGPAPGSVTVRADAGQIIVGNRAFSARWSLGARGPKLHRVQDLSGDTALALSGEVFQIVLADGTTYAASAMLSAGKPVVSDITPDKTASRAADHIAGRRVEVPLRTEDGRLAVTWRAVMREGANYVRQEIELVAARDDLSIREVVWLDEPVPGARTAGAVDGSPVVAGKFFFGFEDPMAVNSVATTGWEIGGWASADLSSTDRRSKAWPVAAALLVAGENQVRFRYERGNHRLDVWKVTLLENGQPVAADVHHGFAGVPNSENVFTLRLAQPNPAAKHEITAEIGTDISAETRPDSFGRVELLSVGGAASCRLKRDAVLRRGEKLTLSFVVGIAPAGQMRRAFLYYIERERAHPYRPFLHYNSWYDTAWSGPFTEAQCLEAVREFGEKLIKPHGVVMDSMVFDDGWDDFRTLWQFHDKLPNGFAKVDELCRRYGTRVGVWLSPFGGYGGPKEARLKHGREQGYEINEAGFSLAGPKYYARFKSECKTMIRQYHVNYFKFDGIAAGSYASGAGNKFILDTEAMRRLMLELRQEEPNLFINLTTGSWPSPFWLRYADSLWRQGEDTAFRGKGPAQQQWLTYRDGETYKNIVKRGPLYPINSLMLNGVSYSRHGNPGRKDFNSAGLKDDIRAMFGGGTCLQELYLMPARLTADDWKVLAEAANWARANAGVLVDTHWIGGDPNALEVYGWAAWTPCKGIVTLRNPNDQPQTFTLDLKAAFELPAAGPDKFVLKSPWVEDAGKTPLTTPVAKPITVTLQPFELLTWEATPAQ